VQKPAFIPPRARVIIRALFLTSSLLLLSGCGDSDPDGTESLRKAEEFYAAGDYGSAEVEYKNTLTADPRQTDAMLRLASIWEARGGPFQAAVIYRTIRNLTPRDTEARLGMARFYLAIGDHQTARKEALELLKIVPDHREALVFLAKVAGNDMEIKDLESRLEFPGADEDARVWFARALIALGRTDLDAADRAFTRAIELDAEAPDVLMYKARLHMMRDEPAEAEASMREASRLAPLRSPERVAYVSYLLGVGKRDEAVSLLESSTKQAPDFIAAWRLLARVAISENEPGKARDFLQKVSGWDAIDFETNVLNAMLYLTEKDDKGRNKAISLLERLRITHPPNAMVEFCLARARLADDETDLAIEALKRAVRVEPGMRDAVIMLGELSLKQRLYAEVVSQMDSYLRRQPGDIEALLLFAEASRMSGSPDKSWAALSSIAEAPKENVRWHMAAGLAAKDLGKIEDARRSLEKVEALDPANARAAAELVGLDIYAGDFAAALARAEKQLELNPQTPGSHYMRANILNQMSRNDEAVIGLNEALRLDPKMVAAHLLLSRIHAAAGKPADAIAQLERANSEVQGNIPVLLSLVSLYDQAGRAENVRKTYEEILNHHPDYISALNNLAFILGESGDSDDLEKAYRLAQQAQRLSPHDPVIADTLGWILFRRGEFERARRYLAEATFRITDDSSVHFHHGMSCLAMGDEAGARAAFSAVAGGPAGYPRRSEALEILARLDAPVEPGESGMRQLEANITLQPLDMVSRLKHGALLEKAGRHADAAAVYVAALEKNPDLYEAISRLAHLHAGPLDDPEKAYQYARKASEIMPNDVRIVVILAKLAFRGGEHQRADVLYQNILSKITGDPGLEIQAAWAAYSMGRVDAAGKLMQAALKAATDPAQRAEAELFLNFQKADPAPGLIEATLATNPAYVPALMARAALNAGKDPKTALPDYEKVLEIFTEFTPAREAIARIREADKDQQ
jgi:tetratricopeptide (TPR) repeat protein